MSTTIEYLAQGARALAAANDAALLDAQTISAQTARILQLEQASTTKPPAPVDPTPVDPGASLVPPQPGIRPPTAPILVSSSKASTRPGEDVTSQLDLAGEHVTHKPSATWQALFELKANASVRHGFLQGDYNGGLLVQSSAPNVSVEDVDVGDHSGECIILRAGARGAAVRRVRLRSFKRYGLFNDGAQGITVEDVHVEDDGTDTHSGSDTESVIRLQAQGSGTISRVRIIYRGPNIKAGLRGDGTYAFTDWYVDGANSGWNPMGGGDGPRCWLVNKVLTSFILTVTNEDETRRAVMAAAASGTTDPIALGKVFRNAGRAWKDENDHTKGDQPLAAVMNDTTHITQSIARRAAEMMLFAKGSFTRCWFNFGFTFQAGSDLSFDGSNKIVGTPAGGDVVFNQLTSTYPEAATKTDPGWTLPYDKKRPAPIVRTNGDRFYGKALSNSMGDDELRKYVKGKFYFNDKLYDWSA